MKKILTMLILPLLLAMTACATHEPQVNHAAPQDITKHQFSTETPTENPTELIPTPTSTSTPYINVELTEKEAEKDPYIFSTGMGNVKVDISYAQIDIAFVEWGLKKMKGQEVHTFVVSPKNLGSFSNTSEASQVGTGAGIIRAEKYGNLFLVIHSGYSGGEPLDAELVFRFPLEESGERDKEFIEENLQKILGSKGIMTIDGVPFEIEVIGAVRLQRNESIYILQHPTEAVDIITKKENGDYMALGNPEIFENLKKDSSHKLIISFCGWGPENDPNRYSYYRYNLLINMEEEYETAPNDSLK